MHEPTWLVLLQMQMNLVDCIATKQISVIARITRIVNEFFRTYITTTTDEVLGLVLLQF